MTLGSAGASGLSGNYGLTDQEAVLRWVNAHISLMGGDNSRVTVGAEQGGADILSLHLLSRPAPLFQRMMLMVSSGRRTRTRTRAEFSPSLCRGVLCFLPPWSNPPPPPGAGLWIWHKNWVARRPTPRMRSCCPASERRRFRF